MEVHQGKRPYGIPTPADAILLIEVEDNTEYYSQYRGGDSLPGGEMGDKEDSFRKMTYLDCVLAHLFDVVQPTIGTKPASTESAIGTLASG